MEHQEPIITLDIPSSFAGGAHTPHNTRCNACHCIMCAAKAHIGWTNLEQVAHGGKEAIGQGNRDAVSRGICDV